MKSKAARVVYDKQCPVCHAYCRLVKSQFGPDEMVLVDAREPSDLMAEITRRGLDIDEGMVVEVGGELHYGADAIAVLAKDGNGKRVFDRLNRLLFRSRRMAHICYPAMRAVRNLLLKILGVDRINNLGRPGKDKF